MLAERSYFHKIPLFCQFKILKKIIECLHGIAVQWLLRQCYVHFYLFIALHAPLPLQGKENKKSQAKIESYQISLPYQIKITAGRQSFFNNKSGFFPDSMLYLLPHHLTGINCYRLRISRFDFCCYDICVSKDIGIKNLYLSHFGSCSLSSSITACYDLQCWHLKSAL